MKYAIIQNGDKQLVVSEGKTILVDKLDKDTGSTIDFPEVLLLRNEDEIRIGTPYIAGGSVKGKIVDHLKGKKVTIIKFKSKVHYRRKIGFRPQYTKVMIESIKVNGK